MNTELTYDELASWSTLTSAQLVDRMASCVQELFGLYQELALVESDERNARVRAHASSEGPNVSARDRDGAAAALPAALEAIKIRGRIAALEAAREFGYVLLDRSR